MGRVDRIRVSRPLRLFSDTCDIASIEICCVEIFGLDRQFNSFSLRDVFLEAGVEALVVASFCGRVHLARWYKGLLGACG